MMFLQVTETKDESRVVLTKPVSVGGDSVGDYKAPNLTQRILSLFKNVRPGSNLTNFQARIQLFVFLSPLFNLPKSQLQCYGETTYCFGKDLLHKCNSAETPLERFISVVAWTISTTRPPPFGLAPYNPILGETHHVSKGSLNVLLEQVSHHPPVSALHATDEKENIEMVWCQYPVPKFLGTRVEAEVLGKRQLKLLNHGETYVTNSPKMLIKFFPPGVEWTGDVKVCCQETGLEANLHYTSSSFLGRGPHFIRGKIYQSSSLKTLYEIDGHWNRTVKVKEVSSGKQTIIYDASEMMSGLKTPTVKDLQGIWPTESALVWGEVSRNILTKKWDKAREAKTGVEEKQREIARDRKSSGEIWVPKHFVATYSKEDGWDCSPTQKWVPPAPIVVPL
ncbi:hypothetical protein Tsubulata_038791 [Turnera subulata]|uniref:Oxysterol-binding protein n=1 Tax=Turnera subulata TaxID=218843 RepID=A0A9Q0FQU9_9ROSI|nr:hypothetical protein Tsubulata_038791 [Turnera subulata]